MITIGSLVYCEGYGYTIFEVTEMDLFSSAGAYIRDIHLDISVAAAVDNLSLIANLHLEQKARAVCTK
jgi:hypothetical protein